MSELSMQLDPSVLASIANAVNRIQQSIQNEYKSVQDGAFAQRLERALEKNFDYIRRKDGLLPTASKVPPPPKPPVFAVKPAPRLGVGATNAQAVADTGKHGGASNITPSGTESPSVYVSNLPKDITEEELEILFGALGKIKKVKIYTTPLGQRKGDALVTYASAEHAATASRKFNGLDIGDGYVISVTRAEFGTNANTGTGNGNGTGSSSNGNGTIATRPEGATTAVDEGRKAQTVHEGKPSSYFVHERSGQSVPSQGGTLTGPAPQTDDPGLSTLRQQEVAAMCAMLPAETEAGAYPVALLMNAFDCHAAAQAEEDSGFFDELEADMLLECCKFGKVRGIQLLTLPVAFLAAVQASARGALPVLSAAAAGCVAVTFRDAPGAAACAQALGGKKFDGRLLIAHVLPALATAPTVPAAGPVPAVPAGEGTSGGATTLPDTSAAPSLTAVMSSVPPPPPPPPRPPSVPKPPQFTISSAAVAVPASAAPSAGEPQVHETVGGSVDTVDQVNIEAISSNVDDFLNSLL